MKASRKHTAPTSRGSSAYPRKRAIAAYQVCRARRTKCDQKKPKCSFCEKTGAQCVSDPQSSSSFVLASLAILERLERLERKLDAAHTSTITREHVNNASSVDARVHRSHEPPLQLEKCLPANMETVLSWPVFKEHNLTAETSSPVSNNSLTTTNGHPSSCSIAENLSIATCAPWLESFFEGVHSKNPVLNKTTARALVRRICVDAPGWNSKSCLALSI